MTPQQIHQTLSIFSAVKPDSIAGHTGTLWIENGELWLANEHNWILHLRLQDIRLVTARVRSGELIIDAVTNEQYILRTYGIPAKALWLRRAINFVVGLAGILFSDSGNHNILDMREYKSVMRHWTQKLREHGVIVTVAKGSWWPYGDRS